MHVYIYICVYYIDNDKHMFTYSLNHIYICCIYIYISVCVRAHAVPIYQVNSSKLTIHEGIGPHSHLPLPGAQGNSGFFFKLAIKVDMKKHDKPTICNI